MQIAPCTSISSEYTLLLLLLISRRETFSKRVACLHNTANWRGCAVASNKCNYITPDTDSYWNTSAFWSEKTKNNSIRSDDTQGRNQATADASNLLGKSAYYALSSYLYMFLFQYLLYLIYQILCLLHSDILHREFQSTHTSLIGIKHLEEKEIEAQC